MRYRLKKIVPLQSSSFCSLILCIIIVFLLVISRPVTTADGLPIEVYVYCNDTAWVDYEAVQSAIFEHILCMVPQFYLRVFQSPSSYDLIRLKSQDKDENWIDG